MILNFHHVHAANAGDLLSSPLEYFEFGSPTGRCGLKDLSRDPQARIDAHLILGGGGLLGNTHFAPEIADAFSRCDGRIVIWGAGINRHAYPIHYRIPLDGWAGRKWQLHGWMVRHGLRKPHSYHRHLQPDYAGVHGLLEQADLVGVRDDRQAWPWVPCASCLHPLLDRYRDEKPAGSVGVIEHPQFMALGTTRWPRLTNTDNSVDTVLRFIAAHRTLVTSSYHAAYWGVLLGRRVVVVPWSSKFMTFRWPVALALDAHQLSEHLARAETFPGALAEARQANLEMAQRVSDLLQVTVRRTESVATSA